MWLTDPPLVIDTDFISCFAWTNRMALLTGIYQDIVVPDIVLYELAKVPHLHGRVEASIAAGAISTISIDTLDPAAAEYSRLIGGGRLGRGESAVMAYVRFHGGTVGSNNVRDVLKYCQSNDLPLLAVRAVVVDAVDQERVLTEVAAEAFWAEMRRIRRRLPHATAMEALEHYRSGPGRQWMKQRY